MNITPGWETFMKSAEGGRLNGFGGVEKLDLAGLDCHLITPVLARLNTGKENSELLVSAQN